MCAISTVRMRQLQYFTFTVAYDCLYSALSMHDNACARALNDLKSYSSARETHDNKRKRAQMRLRKRSV